MTDPLPGPSLGERDASQRRLSSGVLVLLGCLIAVAPLVTDLYLPALPQLADSLGVDDAAAQLTMSVCLVGLALGQLVAGPLSDRVGRTRPLRWGVALVAVTSFLCAVAPTIGVLLALRVVQGLAGSAALVVTRAIVRDVYDGARAARVFSDLILVMGLAPVLGPVIGGQLLRVTDWRGIFLLLGLVTAVLLVAVLRLPETHPPEARSAGGRPAHDLLRLLTVRHFQGYVVMAAMFGVILFGYISLSSFVFQDGYGLSPSAYSLVFAANAAGMAVGSQVNARLVLRVGPAPMLGAALALSLVAATLAAVALAVEAPLAVTLVPLWFVLVALGGSMGNATALALSSHSERAGAAAALLGTAQFLLGALVPPLVSVGGATGTAMGITMVVAAGVAMASYLTLHVARRS